MQTKINAQIVAHSLSPQNDELISVLATFPRFILAEVNTHRMLSKNTSSSRAIPFKKMVETIKEDPFIPIAWQKEHKGMQGSEYFSNKEVIENHIQTWLQGRDEAILTACNLNDAAPTENKEGYLIEEDREGVTKQLCNRLLEPFMWTTMLITGPRIGWNNFFNLRCPQYTLNNDDIFKSKKDFKDFYKKATEVVENHLALPLFAEDADTIAWLKANKGQAEIHMMALAECIWDAVNESNPEKLQAGDWHIPFENTLDFEALGSASVHYYNKTGKLFTPSTSAVAVSVAMAARTSYTVVGEEKEMNYETMIELHDKLLAWDPPHSSPLEHCARAMDDEEYKLFIKGLAENISPGLNIVDDKYKGWCYNLKGFIPYRYLIDNK